MFYFENDNIDDIYRDVCLTLLRESSLISNTLELNNVAFKLTDISNNIINIRNISKSYLFGEMVWYMAGREDTAFIQKFSKFWGKISDNGVTNNSAYGHILFKRHGFNQVEKIIDLLRTDRNSRRAVLNFNVPNPNVIETKDEICTIMLQLYIRDNKLHCTAVMRSNDIWIGTPYDVAFFTELQKYIAHRVGAEYGTYTHYVVSMHVYTRNLDDVKDVLTRKATSKLMVDMEELSKYVHYLEQTICNSTTPKEDIIELFEKLEISKETKYED